MLPRWGSDILIIMSQQAQKIIEVIRPILVKHGVTRAQLFGSIARGDDNPESDVDVLVQMPGDSTLFTRAKLYLDLKDTLLREVDLVSFNYINPLIKDSVLSNTITVI